MSDTSRTAVVTGAARGIGRAIAERMANSGWRVLLADIDEGAAQDVVDALGASGATSLAHRVDVTDRGSVASTIDRA
ncbi:MAG: SDR family NAD(P)-dependent oxidoreductase, partial [Alphaproteobacteria bacterium]